MGNEDHFLQLLLELKDLRGCLVVFGLILKQRWHTLSWTLRNLIEIRVLIIASEDEGHSCAT